MSGFIINCLRYICPSESINYYIRTYAGNSGAANGALQLQPGAGAFDVNAPGRRVPLAHITLPPPPALPPKNDDSDTSSSESSDRGSVRFFYFLIPMFWFDLRVYLIFVFLQ